MKINEKNLAAFATSATPVDREGWLVKRGEVNKGYQKRWFVLKGNLLFYFEKRGDKEPVGVIVLEGCTIGKYMNNVLFFFFTVGYLFNCKVVSMLKVCKCNIFERQRSWFMENSFITCPFCLYLFLVYKRLFP